MTFPGFKALKNRPVNPAAPEARQQRVFISYSRIDDGFVDLFAEALAERGCRVLRDRSDIRHGEDWWNRIVALIKESSTVIFVTSPNSVQSDICRRELEAAAEFSKRLVPIAFRDADEASQPGETAKLNRVSFISLGRRYERCAELRKKIADAERAGAGAGRPVETALKKELDKFRRNSKRDPSFLTGVAQLQQALQLDDIVWHEEGVEWLKRATAWRDAGRDVSALLSRADFTSARQWVDRRPASADVAMLTLELVEESWKGLERDRRRISELVGRAFVNPAALAVEAGACDAALRLTAAGVLLSEDDAVTTIGERVYPFLLAAEQNALRTVVRLQERVEAILAEPDSAHIAVLGRERVWRVNLNDGTVTDLGKAGRGAVHLVWMNGRLCEVRGEWGWSIGIGEVGGREFASLSGHEDAVFSVDCEAKGTLLATGASDKTVKLWSVREQSELRTLEAGEVVWCVTLPADGARVAAAAGKTAKIWLAATGEQVGSMEHHGSIWSIRFDRSGRSVVTASEDGAAVLWDASNGARLATLAGHNGPVANAFFLGETNRFASIGKDDTIRIWDARPSVSDSMRELKRIKAPRGALANACASPDGRLLIGVSEAGEVRVWDTAHTRVRRTQVLTKEGPGLVGDVQISREDEKLTLLDQRSGAGVELVSSGEEVGRVHYASSGAKIVGLSEHRFHVWSAQSGALERSVEHGLIGPGAIAVTPQHNALIARGETGMSVWNVETGEQTWSTPERVDDISLSDNGRWALVSLGGGRQTALEMTQGREVDLTMRATGIAQLKLHAFAPDDQTLVLSRGDAKAIEVWSLIDGRKAREIVCEDKPQALAVGPGGATVAYSTFHPNTVVLARTSGLPAAQRLAAQEGGTHGLRFSADGARLLSWDLNGHVMLHASESGALLGQVKVNGFIRFANFSEDGRIVGLLAVEEVYSPNAVHRAIEWDCSRTIALADASLPGLAAALANGVGLRTDDERGDLLMRDAPDDLCAALKERMTPAQIEVAAQREAVLRLLPAETFYNLPIES